MAKYELELTGSPDAEVLADAIDELSSDGAFPKHTQELLKYAANEIRRQIPIPVPGKVGAVVQTDQGLFIRWSHDNHTHNPWIAVGDHETPLRTDEIGRITEMLSEGADF